MLGKRVLGIAELSGWAIRPERRTGCEAEDMLQAHLERGIWKISWHCARSTVFYHSELLDATLYCDSPEAPDQRSEDWERYTGAAAG